MTTLAKPLELGHFIAGDWTPPGDDAVSVNPAHPREEIGRHALATATDIDDAVEAASTASRAWAELGAVRRGGLLRRAARLIEDHLDELATLLTREEGKTIAEARVEVQKAADAFTYHGSQAWAATGETLASSSDEEEIRTVRLPVGVVAVITPWNFPIAIPAWKLAPALAYGNTVVWKPASLTPIMAARLTELLVEAGLRDGVLNLIFAAGADANRLVDHPSVDAVTFTGSTDVGKEIWRRVTDRGAAAQAEMGGHNPAIVFDDANLDLAARDIVAGAMLSTGQKCTATRRVIVVGAVYQQLLSRLKERVEALRVGDGVDPRTDVGPLVSGEAQRSVAAAVEEGLAKGLTMLARSPLEGLEEGFFFAPTVLGGLRPEMRLAQEEVFGPLLGVIEVDDDDAAIEVANATRYGLSAAAFTGSERRARRVIAEVDAGMVHINNPTPGSEVHVPFGGWRDSTAFAPAEQGLAARDFFTRTKSVFVRPG
jgi:acyl-CoA reductase-like NAD-dependent aldehyde dehydrogenase